MLFQDTYQSFADCSVGSSCSEGPHSHRLNSHNSLPDSINRLRPKLEERVARIGGGKGFFGGGLFLKMVNFLNP